MNFKKREKKLEYFLEREQALLQTPGLKLRVYLKGKKQIDLNYGKVYPLYDVASLTKVAFTLEAFAQSWQQKKWNLSSHVGDFLPWVRALPSVGRTLKVEQLLCHRSGLPAWRPFYRTLLKNVAKDSFFHRWVFLSSLLRKELLKRNSSPFYVYSDVGFLLLGFVLEALYDCPLRGVWEYVKKDSLGLGWHFCPHGKTPILQQNYAPTRECPWQKKTLQGEVDDENTRALGGIAPHAGLFGSMEDMSRLGLLWRRRFHEDSSPLAPFFPQKRKVNRALGWMFPSPKGASCGRFFSPQSFGHTAFTGPSLWYDPQKDLLVLILSHRVYFSPKSQGPSAHGLAYFRLRAKLHDEIVKTLIPSIGKGLHPQGKK